MKETSIEFIAVGILCIFAICLAVGCSQAVRCCPQCRASRNDCRLLDADLRRVEREVADMRRGYRTVPVRVDITNAWEGAK